VHVCTPAGTAQHCSRARPLSPRFPPSFLLPASPFFPPTAAVCLVVTCPRRLKTRPCSLVARVLSSGEWPPGAATRPQRGPAWRFLNGATALGRVCVCALCLTTQQCTYWPTISWGVALACRLSGTSPHPPTRTPALRARSSHTHIHIHASKHSRAALALRCTKPSPARLKPSGGGIGQLLESVVPHRHAPPREDPPASPGFVCAWIRNAERLCKRLHRLDSNLKEPVGLRLGHLARGCCLVPTCSRARSAACTKGMQRPTPLTQATFRVSTIQVNLRNQNTTLTIAVNFDNTATLDRVLA
jgi:hypothetical protein